MLDHPRGVRDLTVTAIGEVASKGGPDSCRPASSGSFSGATYLITHLVQDERLGAVGVSAAPT